jgi:4-amino-4-deoxy-L-arabinose transferase-like glycosyltransferase
MLGTLPFINQAFTIDDPTFLALAAHTLPHPLGLYNFEINWLGEEQRAFDVLANPPLVPWYLALVSSVAHGREWVFHISFWPFLLMTLAGAYRLGRRFAAQQGPVWTMVWTVVAPGFVLASHTVMPDLPLIGCYVLGTALTIDAFHEKKVVFPVIAGSIAGLSALCRYSGMTVIPLLLLYALLHKVRLRSATLAIGAAGLPICLWSAISYKVYGHVHWLALRGFETQNVDLNDALHKTIYEFNSMGLVLVAAPLVGLLFSRSLRRRIWPWIFWALVSVITATVLIFQDHLSRHALPKETAFPLGFGLVGAGVLGVLIIRAFSALRRPGVWQRCGGPDADDLFLACWIVGILTFNYFLFFASVRYLLPALLPAILLLQRAYPCESRSQSECWIGATISMIFAILLSASDQEFANLQKDYVDTLPPATHQRWFNGHWGLQYYLEKTGARALGTSSPVQPGDEIIMVSTARWTILPPGTKLRRIERKEVAGFPALRTVTKKGAGNFYSNWLAQGVYSEVWLPFGISSDPQLVFTRWEVLPSTPYIAISSEHR